MGRELRREDFKLGCLHGIKDAKNKKSEANIQRTVFLSQRIKVRETKKDAPIIRIFAYEVPIEDYKRGRCVDLMGYDKSHNLYIIELKKKESQEKIKDVIEQVNSYAHAVNEIKSDIEKEFKDTFFFPEEFRFKETRKMIIAPREYFEGKKNELTDDAIIYGYYRDQDITKREPKDIINIHIVKRP